MSAIKYTNDDLVAHAKKLLKMNTVYMWGGLAREVTKNYIKMLSGIPAYISQYPQNRIDHLESLIAKNYYGVDCVGLIKSCYFGGIGTKANAPGYEGAYDYDVSGMYNAATEKGPINTIPERPGVCVVLGNKCHIGVYIGNGEVIESTLGTFGDGVVKTKLSARNWAYWIQCPRLKKSNTSAAKPVSPAKQTINACRGIYKSLGVAAMRAEPNLSGRLIKRCSRNKFYPIVAIVTNADGSKWLRHKDGTYSALNNNDPAKTALFIQCGIFSDAVTNAPCNIRTKPTIYGPYLRKMKPGAFVIAYPGADTKADGYLWTRIIYEGNICWVDKNWITQK